MFVAQGDDELGGMSVSFRQAFQFVKPLRKMCAFRTQRGQPDLCSHNRSRRCFSALVFRYFADDAFRRGGVGVVVDMFGGSETRNHRLKSCDSFVTVVKLGGELPRVGQYQRLEFVQLNVWDETSIGNVICQGLLLAPTRW